MVNLKFPAASRVLDQEGLQLDGATLDVSRHMVPSPSLGDTLWEAEYRHITHHQLFWIPSRSKASQSICIQIMWSSSLRAGSQVEGQSNKWGLREAMPLLPLKTQQVDLKGRHFLEGKLDSFAFVCTVLEVKGARNISTCCYRCSQCCGKESLAGRL